ncbi:MAG: hypothetical protein JOZ48_08180 [Acidobacteriaceae bacterium]|nr:hypothetical protein [Acidobacteriaceae bacterium]
MKALLRITLLSAIAAICLFGDVTYDQSAKFTGGSLIDMMRSMANNPMLGRMGGAGMKTAFQDQNFKIYVKGSKMARIGELISSIYDLDAGTVTTINHQKHTYSVMTFDEMREQMQRIQQRGSRGPAPNFDFDVKVDKTGQTRTIDGQTATEVMMTLTAKSASANGQMVVKTDLWGVPLDDTKHELVDFYKRLSEKFAYAFAGGPGLGGGGAGIAAAMKESLKLDSYPILDDIDVSGVAGSMNPMMGQGNPDPNAPLIKMEMHSSNFVAGSVDDSKFAVPAGYSEENRRR